MFDQPEKNLVRDKRVSLFYRTISAEEKLTKLANIRISRKWLSARDTNCRGILSTVDLLIKVTCFVTQENNNFNVKMSWSKLDSQRRATVPSFPFQ